MWPGGQDNQPESSNGSKNKSRVHRARPEGCFHVTHSHDTHYYEAPWPATLAKYVATSYSLVHNDRGVGRSNVLLFASDRKGKCYASYEIFVLVRSNHGMTLLILVPEYQY